MSEMVTGTAHVTNNGHGRATRKGKGDRRDGRSATLDGASGGKQVQGKVRGGENRVGDGVEAHPAFYVPTAAHMCPGYRGTRGTAADALIRVYPAGREC